MSKKSSYEHASNSEFLEKQKCLNLQIQKTLEIVRKKKNYLLLI